MIEIIKRFCEQKALLEIYTNQEDTNRFNVGYVVAYSDDEFIIHSFDDNAIDDGYQVFKISNVYHICQDTIYLHSLQKLINPSYADFHLPQGYCKELNLYNEVLSLCKTQNLMTIVVLNCDLEIYGRIKKCDNNIVEIEGITFDGEYNGISFFHFDDIKVLGLGGIDENLREKLTNKR